MSRTLRRPSSRFVLLSAAIATLGIGSVAVTQSANAQGSCISRPEQICAVANVAINVENNTGEAYYVQFDEEAPARVEAGTTRDNVVTRLGATNVRVRIANRQGAGVYDQTIPVPNNIATNRANLFVADSVMGAGLLVVLL